MSRDGMDAYWKYLDDYWYSYTSILDPTGWMIQTKANGIYLLEFGLLQKINSVANRWYLHLLLSKIILTYDFWCVNTIGKSSSKKLMLGCKWASLQEHDFYVTTTKLPATLYNNNECLCENVKISQVHTNYRPDFRYLTDNSFKKPIDLEMREQER